jgi:hypothetical protein
MTFFKHPKLQCQLVNHKVGTTVDCCLTTTSDAVCNPQGWPPITSHDDFRFTSKRTSDRALTFDQIREQVSCKGKPVAFSWHWLDSAGAPIDEGHMMVATGYQRDSAGEEWIVVNDPRHQSPDRILYSDYVSKVNEYSHWDDFYDIKRH